ncbi:N(5)-(carboxyethyl)ornithine synthase [Lactococcus nasutitermitis]|uniref:N(5)-(Carboxyethyl)ornithine synthase n=1 Tax=Lactococcus nasutitermitis TaxID=1652957 RepID=A0ABV9JE39_9LACT|nr:N(5)-(carboxyethyl)ornithine synthase [Lactococcus nasutitermitis]
MILGFVKSDFPDEKRVALLPEDIKNFENKLYIESGFGKQLDIPDSDYEKAGCQIVSRKEVYEHSEGIFSLKLIQPADYDFIRPGQMIIGWIHPYGSGKSFMKTQAYPKNLIVVDLDSQSPQVFYKNKNFPAKNIPRDMLFRNSFFAGLSGTFHAFQNFGIIPDDTTHIAVLGSGNVSQGAFQAVSKFSSNLRMFYRRTLPLFKETMADYDVIINGIEVGDNGEPIISLIEQSKLKKGTFIIDIAADAGNAIQGNHTMSISHPIYQEHGVYHYVVPNTPSLAYRNVSKILSKQFSQHVFKQDITIFKEMIEPS